MRHCCYFNRMNKEIIRSDTIINVKLAVVKSVSTKSFSFFSFFLVRGTKGIACDLSLIIENDTPFAPATRKTLLSTR